MPGPDAEAAAAIAYLRSPRAVRERAAQILALARAGFSEHFCLDEARLPAVIERVLAVSRARYPDLTAIPCHSRWRHFDAGSVDRLAALDARLEGLGREEALRVRFELATTSVLLDAGAGPAWSFREPGTGQTFRRSEGLAVASYHAFTSGLFSSGGPDDPLRADAGRLAALTAAELASAFQAGPRNPLPGLQGRVTLLQRLARAVRAAAALAGLAGAPRVGHLADILCRRATLDGSLPASEILALLLEVLGPVWPGGACVGGVSLGDVWPHPRVGLVPFHKLSQWLTYSLVEPLQRAGLRVVALEDLTGLAEYRNGGLFVDSGVVVPRHAGVAGHPHPVGAPVIVEWRGLTLALLDRTADEIRSGLGLTARELPLASILEGGTWAAGRQIAGERRPDGTPPILVESDGTVF